MIRSFFLLILISIFVFYGSLLHCEETIWYWNGSDSLNDRNHLRLKKIGIKKIFLKAGHFWFYNDQFGINSFKYPEPAGLLKKFDIHLVYTFAQSGKDNFYKQMIKEPKKAVKYIIDTVEWQIAVFNNVQHPVKGLQFDLEGHVDLELYARLLKAVKKKFPSLDLSIAVQPFWQKKKGFKKLLNTVDFHCLMLYDFHKAKKQGNISKIADIDWILKEISKFNLLKKPFYAGLPTYSYSMLYNKKGKLIKNWAPFRLEGLSENKYFKYKSTKY
ncbi:glycoside hydrolase family 18 protein, partial [bacterium]|nr:glycoside hydrolase family 18 protein [bacterium]